MPNLADHAKQKAVKFLYLGDSGTGKTGSLASLALAGYSIRILDYDNGLDPLVSFIRKQDPSKLASVDYETLRDDYVPSPLGPPEVRTPKAFAAGIKLLDKWSDGSSPKSWGLNTVFVLDSLTHFSNSAFEWARAMNPTSKEPRQWYFTAQKAVENTIALLTSEAFHAHVIVTAHVRWQTRPDGSMKGYAESVGVALGPTLPTYFNTVVLAESVGVGERVNRTIRTVPTALIDLKNPVPFEMPPALPLGTGLATLFETMRK